MSDQIKVGDLVMVVRPRQCCGTSDHMMGRMFIVTKIALSAGNECKFCSTLTHKTNVFYERSVYGTDILRLKRIDPPALPESITADEKASA